MRFSLISMMAGVKCARGVAVLGPTTAEQAEILTTGAQDFVATLHRCFNARRKELLQRRVLRQKELDAGAGLRTPGFPGPEVARVTRLVLPLTSRPVFLIPDAGAPPL